MQWTRPNTAAVAVQEDIRQCHQQAHLRAARLPLAHGSSFAAASASPGREVSIAATPAAAQSEAAQQEFELMTNCMHGKGYKLEPVQ